MADAATFYTNRDIGAWLRLMCALESEESSPHTGDVNAPLTGNGSPNIPLSQLEPLVAV